MLKKRWACASNPKVCPEEPSMDQPEGRSLRPKSTLAKKKALSLTMGPPRLAPYCLSSKVAIGFPSTAGRPWGSEPGPSPTRLSLRKK